jgi:hypothetical protein
VKERENENNYLVVTCTIYIYSGSERRGARLDICCCCCCCCCCLPQVYKVTLPRTIQKIIVQHCKSMGIA